MSKIVGVLIFVALVFLTGSGLYLYGDEIYDKIYKTGSFGNPLTVYGDKVNKIASSDRIEFGSDIAALDFKDEIDWKPQYTVVWAGQWMNNDPYGWQTFDGWLDKIYSEGSTPVILWYYWGNDTAPEKISKGTANKSVKEWYAMTERVGDSLSAIMGDRKAIVVIEPEFNKHGTENWTGFNKHLINLTSVLHSKNSNIQVAIGFGNWNRENWTNFLDAVNAADMVGYSSLVRYPEDSKEDYQNIVQESIDASEFLQEVFPGKPIILYDFGASSFPEPDFYYIQQDALKMLFDNIDALKDAGTKIVIYRNFKDVTQYNRPEDQHWGLLDSKEMRKPAYSVWIDGVRNSSV